MVRSCRSQRVRWQSSDRLRVRLLGISSYRLFRLQRRNSTVNEKEKRDLEDSRLGRFHPPGNDEAALRSHYFKQHRQEYYDKLQGVRDPGTWEEWLRFFLRGVVAVSEQGTSVARRILLLREAHRQTITEQFGRAAANGHWVLEHLYEHTILSVNEIRELTGTTYQAANELVSRLTSGGVLTEVTGQSRNRKFMYQSYIDLFPRPMRKPRQSHDRQPDPLYPKMMESGLP